MPQTYVTVNKSVRNVQKIGRNAADRNDSKNVGMWNVGPEGAPNGPLKEWDILVSV